jgi:benzil reductase ((S)-benzoin forming)
MQIKAIVTGHTQGLGAALALSLLHRGIPVLGIARGFSDALSNRFPQLCLQAKMSLDDLEAINGWLATPALKDYLDGCTEVLLINNAGIVNPVGALLDQDPLEVARAISLNVAAPLMLAAAVVQATPGKQRRVLHISSGAGRSAYPGWSVYCATKAALDHHARAVALDALPGVRICSLAPGVIDTGMQAQIRGTADARFPMRQRFVDMKLNGELATAEDTAERVVDYLLAATFGQKPVDDIRSATS